ncbi:MAG: hypothetical protein EAZ37_09400 [Burkholderiales bacterium]|nr:MAG: hypothetical protein EAZ37_09400 [Burkholderiales bacterium]
MRCFVTILLFTAAFNATANIAPDEVGLHIGSFHSSKQFTDFNPGVNASWGAWTVGAFRNSEAKNSVFAGYSIDTKGVTALDLRASLMAGAATGYAARQVTMILVPSLNMKIADGQPNGLVKQTRLVLTYIPKLEKQGAHALHVSLRFVL